MHVHSESFPRDSGQARGRQKGNGRSSMILASLGDTGESRGSQAWLRLHCVPSRPSCVPGPCPSCAGSGRRWPCETGPSHLPGVAQNRYPRGSTSICGDLLSLFPSPASQPIQSYSGTHLPPTGSPPAPFWFSQHHILHICVTTRLIFVFPVARYMSFPGLLEQITADWVASNHKKGFPPTSGGQTSETEVWAGPCSLPGLQARFPSASSSV